MKWIAILFCLCTVTCLEQSFTQYSLYIDSVKGSDWYSGSETAPLASLSKAFSEAQSQGRVNATFYLIPNYENSYLLPDLTIDGNTLPIINIQTKFQNSTESGYSTLVISGNALFDQVNLTLNQVNLTSNPQNNYQMRFNSGFLKLIKTLITYERINITTTERSPLFLVLDGSAIIESSTIQSNTSFFRANNSVIKFDSTSITYFSKDGPDTNIFFFSSCDLEILTLNFTGQTFGSLPIVISTSNAIFMLHDTSLKAEKILYSPLGIHPIKFIAGRGMKTVLVNDFSLQNSNIASSVLEFSTNEFDSLLSAQMSRISIMNNVLNNLDVGGPGCSGIICFGPIGKLDLAISDVSMMNNTRSVYDYKDMAIFKIQALNMGNVAFKGLKVLNNTMSTTLIDLYGSFTEIMLEDISIRNNVMTSNVMQFHLMTADAYSVQQVKPIIKSLNFVENRILDAQLIYLESIAPNASNSSLLALNYLTVDNLTMVHNNVFSSDPFKAQSLISSNNIEMRIQNSVVSDNHMSDTTFINLTNQMVTVVIANSSFICTSTEKCITTRLFSYEKMDFNKVPIYDSLNKRYGPDFGSFCLLNNTFAEGWSLFDPIALNKLNVANFFIHDNKFINTSISGQELFAVTDIVPLKSWEADTMRILLNVNEKKIIDPLLNDRLLLGLFQKAIFENSGIDTEKKISCVFSFSGNQFTDVNLDLDNLMQISTLIPNTLIDVSNNIFSRIHRAPVQQKNEFINILSAVASSHVSIRNNTVSLNTAPLFFLKIEDGATSNSTNIVIHNNTLNSNELSPFLSLETHSALAINISENVMRDSLILKAAALRVVVSDGEPSVQIFGNNFSNVTGYVEGVTQISLIVFEFQKETSSSIIFQKNSFVENTLVLKGLNPSVMGYKNCLVYLFNVNSSIIMKNNTFRKNCVGTSTPFLVTYSRAILIDELLFIHQSSFFRSAVGYSTTAIYIATQHLTVTRSHFESNYARAGGALSIDYLIKDETATLNASLIRTLIVDITGNNFTNNFAEVRGGAICFEQLRDGVLLIGMINGNYFGWNTAMQGSAIYLENSIVQNLTLAYNTFALFAADSVTVNNAVYLARLPQGTVKNQVVLILNSTIITYDNEYLASGRKLLFDFSDVSGPEIIMQNVSFIAVSSIPVHLTLIRATWSVVRIRNTVVTGISSRSPLILLSDGATVSVDSSSFTDINLLGGGSVISFNSESDSGMHLDFINSIMRNVTASIEKDRDVPASPILVSSRAAFVSIKDSQFIENKAVTGAVVFANIDHPFPQSTIKIDNSSFYMNMASIGGGAIYQKGGTLEIYNSSFKKNEARMIAGAIHIENPATATIKDTHFEENVVTDFLTLTFGGALYVELNTASKSKLELPTLDIYSNNFTNNCAGSKEGEFEQAIGSGGAIYFHFHQKVGSADKFYEAIKMIGSNNAFQNNFAQYGPDYATNPVSGSFSSFDSEENIIIECSESPCQLSGQVRADIFRDLQLRIRFIDLFGQQLTQDSYVSDSFYSRLSDFKMTLQVSNQPQYYSESTCSPWTCILNGVNLQLKGLANESIGLTFTISNPSYHDVEFVLMTSIRPCQIGEINDTAQLACIPCAPRTYSVNLADQTCHKCPPNADCPGGWKVNPIADYWKPSIYSTNIYKCNQSGVCNYSAYGENICKQGYQGPFCLACDLDKQYAASGSTCAKCPPLWQGMVILVLIQLGIFIFEIGYIWYFRKQNNSVVVNNKFNKSSIDRFSRRGYLTILLDYIQVLAILKNYPLMVSGFIIGLTHIGSPSEMLFYSSDCVFIQLGFSSENLFYAKLMATIILPFLKIGLCLAFGFAKKFIYSSYRFGTYVVVAVQCIVMIEQPSMISTLASTLLCKSTDPLAKDQSTVDYYLSSHPHVTCYTETHIKLRNKLVIPMLILWGVCIPLLLLIILISNRARLQTNDFATKFGAQYALFKSKFFFWSQVQFIQKLILILFANISFLSLKMMGLTLFLALMANLIIIKEFRPFRSIDLEKTYIRSLQFFLFTIFLAVYAYEEEELNGVISTLIILINAAFIAIIVIKILHLFGFRFLARHINSILNRIMSNTGEKQKNYFFEDDQNSKTDLFSDLNDSLEEFSKTDDEAKETRITQIPPEKHSRYQRLSL